jgi:hypothetical protein
LISLGVFLLRVIVHVTKPLCVIVRVIAPAV